MEKKVNNRFPERFVFLSFKSEEIDRAVRLKSSLQEEGYEVWWQQDLQCGQEWHGEIDKAIGEASCVIVCWSVKAVASEWVKHEASQAMVRGVYAPVRMELIHVPSPFNRIQATDLDDWNSERRHPGFQSLLKRLDELIPPPRSSLRRAKDFIISRFWTLVASTIALAAVSLLWTIYSGQDRLLHPVENSSLVFEVVFDTNFSGVRNYLSDMEDVDQNADLRRANDDIFGKSLEPFFVRIAVSKGEFSLASNEFINPIETELIPLKRSLLITNSSDSTVTVVSVVQLASSDWKKTGSFMSERDWLNSNLLLSIINEDGDYISQFLRLETVQFNTSQYVFLYKGPKHNRNLLTELVYMLPLDKESIATSLDLERRNHTFKTISEMVRTPIRNIR